ncbi:hypothetical protein D3C76_1307880 [compost metagenome]
MQRVAGVGRGHGTKHVHHARQQRPRLFQRHEGIFKIRLGRVVGNLLHFLQLLLDTGINCRSVVALFNQIERRRLERQATLVEERVLVLFIVVLVGFTGHVSLLRLTTRQRGVVSVRVSFCCLCLRAQRHADRQHQCR